MSSISSGGGTTGGGGGGVTDVGYDPRPGPNDCSPAAPRAQGGG